MAHYYAYYTDEELIRIARTKSIPLALELARRLAVWTKARNAAAKLQQKDPS